MSMRKLKVCVCVYVCATFCRHHVCAHNFSECNHAKAVQAVCHNNVVLQLESECVGFKCVYGCLLVFACLHTSVGVGVFACMSLSM